MQKIYLEIVVKFTMSLGEFCLSPQFSACVSVANLVFIIFEEKVWNRF